MNWLFDFFLSTNKVCSIFAVDRLGCSSAVNKSSQNIDKTICFLWACQFQMDSSGIHVCEYRTSTLNNRLSSLNIYRAKIIDAGVCETWFKGSSAKFRQSSHHLFHGFCSLLLTTKIWTYKYFAQLTFWTSLEGIQFEFLNGHDLALISSLKTSLCASLTIAMVAVWISDGVRPTTILLETLPFVRSRR